VARSEGGGVEVNGGSTTMTKSLMKRIAAACSEAEVEVVASSRVGDKKMACSNAEIKEDRWRQWHGGF
jgi:hypothetical protein